MVRTEKMENRIFEAALTTSCSKLIMGPHEHSPRAKRCNGSRCPPYDLWGKRSMTTILQCPVCRDLLLLSADGYQCSRMHTFDAARQGYVNFLLSHKKHSKEPGDSPEMIMSRRRFLNLGFYDKISEGINQAVVDALPDTERGSAFMVLDAGCGEGFYLKRLKERLSARFGDSNPVEYYGVDISKFAVRQATQRDKAINWFVASIADLPFVPASFDIVLNVFSPANSPEFSKILKKTGKLVLVSPGPRHLNGLREIIYPVAREHTQPEMVEQARELFALSACTRINYPIELKTKAEIMDLLAMTPYFWNIGLNTKSKVAALDRLAMEVDVKIRVLNKIIL
jgi:23S rRNA (guanine745-N1)-methyltransferase